MGEYKESLLIRFLKKLGIIREYSVSKRQMCENAQASKMCDRKNAKVVLGTKLTGNDHGRQMCMLWRNNT